MSPEDVENKRRKIPELILRALISKGKTIEQIRSETNRSYDGASDQIQHASKSIWHNKPEIDDYVKNELNISYYEWNESTTSRGSVSLTYVAQ